VGRLVVAELLNTNYTIRAVTRDVNRAKTLLPISDRIEIVKCDLGDASQVRRAFRDVDQCIWCASGFTSQVNCYTTSLFNLLTAYNIL
jgi:uncharacterized protein YbjT (DUF2867 family)